MASRRNLKKDIDYLAGEVIANSYSCLYFNPERNRNEVIKIIEDAVELRNLLFSRIKPEEKNNRSLVKKHYAAIRNDLLTGIDGLFERLSETCK
ncbi:MAG: hypothetical protein LIO79_09450 [Rikenellaceae bacterium]|nr:hypothetical protein [Rikenellaceae bacterium]